MQIHREWYLHCSLFGEEGKNAMSLNEAHMSFYGMFFTGFDRGKIMGKFMVHTETLSVHTCSYRKNMFYKKLLCT